MSFVRSVSKLALNTARVASVRALSTKAPMVQFRANSVRPVLMNTYLQGVKFYSSDVKFTAEQVESKVLEILKNFDRIRENPAKPAVTLESHLTKDLGLDSLDHVEIIVQLEDTFGKWLIITFMITFIWTVNWIFFKKAMKFRTQITRSYLHHRRWSSTLTTVLLKSKQLKCHLHLIHL